MEFIIIGITAVAYKSGHLKVPAVWVGAECTVKKRGNKKWDFVFTHK
jgi:hypothetical protein